MIKNCASAATRPAEASSETVRSSESLRLSTKTKTCTGLPGRAQDNPAHHTETQIRLDSALGGSILYFVVVDSERQIKHYKSLTHACMHACTARGILFHGCCSESRGCLRSRRIFTPISVLSSARLATQLWPMYAGKFARLHASD